MSSGEPSFWQRFFIHALSYWSIALVTTPTPTASPRMNGRTGFFSSTKKHFFVPLPSFQTFKCNRWKFQLDNKVSLSSIQEGQTLSQQRETKKTKTMPIFPRCAYNPRDSSLLWKDVGFLHVNTTLLMNNQALCCLCVVFPGGHDFARRLPQ